MRILFLLILAFAVYSCTSNRPAGNGEEEDTATVVPNSLADTLLTLQKLEDSAESTKDFKTLDALLSPRLLITRLDGGVWTRDQLYEDIKSLSEENYANPVYEDVHSTRSGNTALLSYKVSFGRQGANADDTLRYRITTTWVREKSKWKMLGMVVGRVE